MTTADGKTEGLKALGWEGTGSGWEQGGGPKAKTHPAQQEECSRQQLPLWQEARWHGAGKDHQQREGDKSSNGGTAHGSRAHGAGPGLVLRHVCTRVSRTGWGGAHQHGGPGSRPQHQQGRPLWRGEAARTRGRSFLVQQARTKRPGASCKTRDSRTQEGGAALGHGGRIYTQASATRAHAAATTGGALGRWI